MKYLSIKKSNTKSINNVEKDINNISMYSNNKMQNTPSKPSNANITKNTFKRYSTIFDDPLLKLSNANVRKNTSNQHKPVITQTFTKSSNVNIIKNTFKRYSTIFDDPLLKLSNANVRKNTSNQHKPVITQTFTKSNNVNIIKNTSKQHNTTFDENNFRNKTSGDGLIAESQRISKDSTPIYVYKEDMLKNKLQFPGIMSYGFNKSKKCCFRVKYEDFKANYKTIETLGSGSFGVIREIETLCCNSNYAIKEIDLGLKDNMDKLLDGFIDEEIYFANYFQKYPSKYILQPLQFYSDNGKYFICYDVLENILYRPIYIFREKKIKNIVKKLFLGIAILHKRKIRHCDIKPANIGFDKKGNLKIFDFGTSNKLNSGYKMNTNSGIAMYIPPDFFRFNLCLKSYADWWAFGITIYQIIENQYPFLVKEKMCDVPINLSNEDFKGFTRDIDNNLKDLIKKLLEVDINKRLGVGNNGTKDILKHAFFKNTNAKKLYRKEK